MANHMLVTAQGDYTQASLAAETWQVGIRLLVQSGSLPDQIGDLAVVPLVARATNRNETDCTITGNWTTELGINDFDPADYLFNEARPAFDTWLGSSFFPSSTRLRTLKIYPIRSPDGKVEPAPPFATGTPVVLTWKGGSEPLGGGGSSRAPLQIAMVASHRTGQVGRPGRGRMFLPTPGPAFIGADGLLSVGTPAAVATAQKTLLESLQLSFGVGGISCYPIVTGGTFTKYAMINQVRVGNVPDTQRRRRRALPETYDSVSVVIA